MSFGRRDKEQGLSRELDGIDLSVLEAVEPEKCTLNADGGDDVLPQQVEWCELHKRISIVCSNAIPDFWRRQARTEKVEAIRVRQLAALRALMKAALKSLEPEMRTAFDYLVKVCQGWDAKDTSELHQNAQDALQSCGGKIPSSNTLQLCRFFTRSMVEQEYDDMRTAVALFCSHLLELTSCIVCKQSDSDNGLALQQMGVLWASSKYKVINVFNDVCFGVRLLQPRLLEGENSRSTGDTASEATASAKAKTKTIDVHEQLVKVGLPDLKSAVVKTIQDETFAQMRGMVKPYGELVQRVLGEGALFEDGAKAKDPWAKELPKLPPPTPLLSSWWLARCCSPSGTPSRARRRRTCRLSQESCVSSCRLSCAFCWRSWMRALQCLRC